MEFQNWNFDIENRIAIIIINNPPVNALSIKAIEELDQIVDDVIANKEIRVAVISGTGAFFSAGVDVREMMQIKNKQQAHDKALTGQQIFNKIDNSPKPFIAAINGMCVGGALELALACQLRICDEKAELGLVEINIGLIPGFGGSQRLTRLINMGRAIEMIITGERISAQEAFQIGLVNKITPNTEVIKHSVVLAQKIAQKSTVAISKALHVIHHGLEMNLDDALQYEAKVFSEVCVSEDTKEGVMAFLQKRPPQFKDR